MTRASVSEPTSPATVAVEWCRSVSQIEALAGDWAALEATVQDRTPLATFEYSMTWYRNYAGIGDWGEPLVGAARRGARLIGVAPMVLRHGSVGRVPVTRVEFAPHEAQGGEFLIEDDHPETVAAFVDALADSVKFDLVCLNGIDPTSRRFSVLQDAASRRGLATELTDHPYAVVDLTDGYDAYCHSMSGNFRRSLKRQAQRIAAAGPAKVSGIHLNAGVDEIDACLGRLFAITEASYKLKGQPLALRHRNCLTELAERFAPRGMLCLSILSLDGKDAAFVIGLAERGCFYDVQLAYGEAFADLSPGAYLMQELLQKLAASGVHTVISHGAHEYKKRWATAFVPNKRMFLFTPGFRSTASRIIRFSLGPVWRRLGQPEP